MPLLCCFPSADRHIVPAHVAPAVTCARCLELTPEISSHNVIEDEQAHTGVSHQDSAQSHGAPEGLL